MRRFRAYLVAHTDVEELKNLNLLGIQSRLPPHTLHAMSLGVNQRL